MSFVDHPQHYNFGGPLDEDGSAKFEVIKIIEDLGWGFDFCMANALKYILRAPYKGAQEQDLDKARWYLERAQRLSGRLRAMTFRKLDTDEALVAWGLLPEGATAAEHGDSIARSVACICQGDPFGALAALSTAVGGAQAE